METEIDLLDDASNPPMHAIDMLVSSRTSSEFGITLASLLTQLQKCDPMIILLPTSDAHSSWEDPSTIPDTPLHYIRSFTEYKTPGFSGIITISSPLPYDLLRISSICKTLRSNADDRTLVLRRTFAQRVLNHSVGFFGHIKAYDNNLDQIHQLLETHFQKFFPSNATPDFDVGITYFYSKHARLARYAVFAPLHTHAKFSAACSHLLRSTLPEARSLSKFYPSCMWSLLSRTKKEHAKAFMAGAEVAFVSLRLQGISLSDFPCIADPTNSGKAPLTVQQFLTSTHSPIRFLMAAPSVDNTMVLWLPRKQARLAKHFLASEALGCIHNAIYANNSSPTLQQEAIFNDKQTAVSQSTTIRQNRSAVNAFQQFADSITDPVIANTMAHAHIPGGRIRSSYAAAARSATWCVPRSKPQINHEPQRRGPAPQATTPKLLPVATRAAPPADDAITQMRKDLALLRQQMQSMQQTILTMQSTHTDVASTIQRHLQASAGTSRQTLALLQADRHHICPTNFAPAPSAPTPNTWDDDDDDDEDSSKTVSAPNSADTTRIAMAARV